MKNLICWFDIPANDLDRAVKFYENVFGLKAEVVRTSEDETMACLSSENREAHGSIYTSSKERPSDNSLYIHFDCGEDVNEVLKRAEKFGGTIIQTKGKIPAEGFGYCGVIRDSEGNKIGVYSDN
jgi:predicted enzyme related to lactoylglutathione lyase